MAYNISGRALKELRKLTKENPSGIFDIFEEKEINDSAYYYQIHQSSPKQKDFEIYCRSGTSIEIKRI